MISFNIENVDELKEAKETVFGFNGPIGVIRTENNEVIGFYKNLNF